MRLGVLAAVVGLTAAVGACGTDDLPAAATPPSTVTTPAATEPTAAAPEPTTEAPEPAKPTTRAPSKPQESDLSQLERIGVDIGGGMVLDVADDGVDRFLQIGANGVVDFTGASHTDSTMMSFQPAPVSARNRVVIKPPFWNEDTGAGSCVADTSGAALKLETCRAGRDTQIWQVVPAGDSGQFELRGAFGILSVKDGRLTTGDGGRTGLQTLDFRD
ncbi:hypothetical protein M1L60_24145 [Actinoplanes sp. TRM 88003]|uniref:Ricin B lectin domain-containing protein n=1 Tax=Paractinoplanes aksuensis TaxID=2939490 RepID=A0ABT1DS78_9ACTN|nr:hypothetical protein [Actinoplanes aksuensis]MCO8273691.1 hypothetical protein [Actinoplanes aksuensis]